jgi:hypothetical protein
MTQDVSMVSMASMLQISNNEQHCQAVHRISYHVLSTLQEPNFTKYVILVIFQISYLRKGWWLQSFLRIAARHQDSS